MLKESQEESDTDSESDSKGEKSSIDGDPSANLAKSKTRKRKSKKPKKKRQKLLLSGGKTAHKGPKWAGGKKPKHVNDDSGRKDLRSSIASTLERNFSR